MIRTNFKKIADEYDKSLVEDGILGFKPEGSLAEELDKHGVDAFDLQGRRVDTKYPESIKKFYFQVSKILNNNYTWTEDYWFIFHNMIYKFHCKDLKAFVNTRKADWILRQYPDGYSEYILGFKSISEMEMANPYEKSPLSEKTAKLIERNIMSNSKGKYIVRGILPKSMNKWIEYLRNGETARQNYSCFPSDIDTDGCFRYQRYLDVGSDILIDSGHYFKIPGEIADKYRKFNNNTPVISRRVVESNSLVY